MSKVDLDELDEIVQRSGRYGYPYTEYCSDILPKIKDIAAELRAARSVVEEAKGHIDTAFILQTVLKEYDEATK